MEVTIFTPLLEVLARNVLLCKRLRLRSHLMYLDERRAGIYYFIRKIKDFEVSPDSYRGLKSNYFF
jgi:hypothetical protein